MKKEEVYEKLNKAYFSENCHEKALLENIPRLISNAKLFVDIGASLGQYTKIASECMSAGNILAIEADPIRYEELQRNAGKWQINSKAKIETLFSAVGNLSGKVAFFTTNSNVSGGLFTHSIKGNNKIDWEKIEVPSVTLDDLFPNILPDFIKADIEGAELRMLQGSKNILKKKTTVFLLELHRWEDPEIQNSSARGPIIRFMRAYGYRPVPFYNHTLFFPIGIKYFREMLVSGTRLHTKILMWLKKIRQ